MTYPIAPSNVDLKLALESIIDGTGAYARDRQVTDDIWNYHLSTRRWSRAPGVYGFGIGLRKVSGRFTEDLGLTVFVDRKRPLSSIECPIPGRVFVPGVDHEIPVDVLDVGKLCLQQGGTLVSGGSRIRHERDVDGFGTFGCLVQGRENPSKRYILSNSHVLALKGAAAPGENICAVQTNGTSSPPIAKLTKWIPYFEGPGYPNLVDAAIAEVLSRDVSPSIGNIGPTGLGKLCYPGMRVHIIGGASGQTGSNVVHVSATMEFDIPTISGGHRKVGFRDQVVCLDYTNPGDSGSCVLNDRGRAIGIHFLATDWTEGGETQRVSVFNPMENVLSELKNTGFDLEIVTIEGSLDLSGLPVVGGATASTITVPPTLALGGLPPVDHREDAIDIMARTIWGEARGEETEGMKAVSEVIYNRAMKQSQSFGETIEAVCRKPFQFSCWNAGDPNRDQLLRVKGDDLQFQLCLQISKQVVNGAVTNLSKGARHYYDKRIAPPNWATGHTPCAEIRNHLFFNDVQ